MHRAAAVVSLDPDELVVVACAAAPLFALVEYTLDQHFGHRRHLRSAVTALIAVVQPAQSAGSSSHLRLPYANAYQKAADIVQFVDADASEQAAENGEALPQPISVHVPPAATADVEAGDESFAKNPAKLGKAFSRRQTWVAQRRTQERGLLTEGGRRGMLGAVSRFSMRKVSNESISGDISRPTTKSWSGGLGRTRSFERLFPTGSSGAKR